MENKGIEESIIEYLEAISNTSSNDNEDNDPNISQILAKMWERIILQKKELITLLNPKEIMTDEEICRHEINAKFESIQEKMTSIAENINTKRVCDYFLAKRKVPFTSPTTIVGSILFPLEFVTKDIFLCFDAANKGLKFITPALKFMSKYLPWVAGASFILNGLCMLAEQAQETNKDPSRIIEANIYILGGAACIALATLAPYSYLVVLAVVWGFSAGMFVAKSINTLMKNYQARDILINELFDKEISHDEQQSPTKDMTLTVVENRLKGITNLNQSQKEFLQAKIAKIKEEKGENKQSDDSEEVFTEEKKISLEELKELLDPHQGVLNTIKSNSFITNAYVVFSFTCYVVSSFAPEAAFIPAMIGYIVSTSLIVGKRIYNLNSNPEIKKSLENPFMDSRQTEQIYNGNKSRNQDPKVITEEAEEEGEKKEEVEKVEEGVTELQTIDTVGKKLTAPVKRKHPLGHLAKVENTHTHTPTQGLGHPTQGPEDSNKAEKNKHL